jgi:hypothetical protein
MAAIAYRRGYGWSLPGMSAARPGGGASPSQIRVFTAKGLSAPGVLGTAPLPQIGTPIPGTFLVYVRPRLSQDELGASGGSQFPYVPFRYPGQSAARPGGRPAALPSAVHYTNPEYAFYREKRRTPSLGMARAGQMGQTMTVPYEAQTPFFSVP